MVEWGVLRRSTSASSGAEDHTVRGFEDHCTQGLAWGGHLCNTSASSWRTHAGTARVVTWCTDICVSGGARRRNTTA